MIQAGLFSAFGFIERNPWAQVVLLLGVGYIALKARDKWRDRNTTKRVQRRIEKQSRRVQQTIREKQDEKSTQVARARESAPRGVPHSDELPDNLRNLIISD
ncbi:MAG: LMBR1 domain-containing protein [Epibacterium sp.]|nr:LMBR1 domain-containing protein [Epibacterium sp.]NQX75633.1 hypothetical protein [Epibacterium sp.]